MKTTAELINLSQVREGSPIRELVEKLNCRLSYSDEHPKRSVMAYEDICRCDTGFLCEHRLQYIVDFLKPLIKMIIPMLFCFSTQAQVTDVLNVIQSRSSVTLASDEALEFHAKENARHIIIAYNEDDPSDLQNVIDNIPNDWFIDMDVFLGEDLDVVIEHIKATPHAAFIEHAGKVVIDVSQTYDICLVTVYCIPSK